MSYFEHNDSIGREKRERIANYHADRARMLAAFADYELGAVTMFLPADAAQLRAREAIILSGHLGV